MDSKDQVTGVALGGNEAENEAQDDAFFKDEAQENLAALNLVGVYRHYKGPLYTVYSVSIHESTLETMVHYYSHEKKSRWTRSYDNFFEVILPKGKKNEFTSRFTKEREATTQEFLEAVGFTFGVAQ